MQGVLWDGLRTDSLVDASIAACLFVAEHFGMPWDREKNDQVVMGACPKQYDTWSCGHRIILTLNFILEVFKSNSKPLPEIIVPDKAVNNKRIAKLCGNITEVKDEDPLTSFRQLKREIPSYDTKPSKILKTEPAPKPMQVEQTPDTSAFPAGPVPNPMKVETPKPAPAAEPVPNPMKVEAPKPAPAAEPVPNPKKVEAPKPAPEVPAEPIPNPMKVEVPKLASSTPPKRSLEALNEEKPLSTPPRPTKQEGPASKETKSEEDMTLEAVVEYFMDARSEKKAEKEALAKGKKILAKHNLKHNDAFQKVHAGLSVKGHWNTFVMAVAGRGSVNCKLCEQLIIDHKIPVSRDEQEKDSDEDPAAEPMPKRQQSQWDESQLAPIVPFEGATKRGRRGRPRKGESAVFDLKTCLAEERQGIYRWLDRDEVQEKLLPPGATEEKLNEEMKKHPVFCIPCQVYLRFKYLTNSNALERHEQSTEHRLALQQMEISAGEPAEQKNLACRGLNLSSEEGMRTHLGSIREHVRDWALLGCPAVVNSVISAISVVSRLCLN